MAQPAIERLRGTPLNWRRKEVYTPAQFIALLKTALANDRDVLLYLALAGLGFFRTQEMSPFGSVMGNDRTTDV
jgi:hypothetical protein